jgi:hypothetical protein
MRFAADHSETLEVFFLPSTDGISGHINVSHSVVCEMATVKECTRCVGWLFETQTRQHFMSRVKFTGIVCNRSFPKR